MITRLREQRFSGVNDGDIVGGIYFAAIPHITFILLEQFLGTREEDVIGALTLAAHLAVFELPRKPGIGDIDANRIDAEFTTQVRRLGGGCGHEPNGN